MEYHLNITCVAFLEAKVSITLVLSTSLLPSHFIMTSKNEFISKENSIIMASKNEAITLKKWNPLRQVQRV